MGCESKREEGHATVSKKTERSIAVPSFLVAPRKKRIAPASISFNLFFFTFCKIERRR